MFVPADGLVAVTVMFAPDKKRSWYLASVAGAILAVLIFYFLSISEFRHWTIDFLSSHNYENFYHDFVRTTRKEGYLALCIATITFVPPAIGMIAGAVAGLDPLAVFLIVSGLKSLRIWLLMEIVKRGWSALILIRQKIKHRHDSEPKETPPTPSFQEGVTHAEPPLGKRGQGELDP